MGYIRLLLYIYMLEKCIHMCTPFFIAPVCVTRKYNFSECKKSNYVKLVQFFINSFVGKEQLKNSKLLFVEWGESIREEIYQSFQ